MNPRDAIMSEIKVTAVVFLTYLVGMALIAGSGADCPFKGCYCYSATISCEEKGLTQIPPLVSQNYTSSSDLIFDGNLIATIPVGSLPHKLAALSLINNPTDAIDDHALDESSDTMRAITMSSFNLTRIPTALGQLNNLQVLSLYEARIQDWNSDVMKKLGKTLTLLYLSDLGMTSWPDWLQSFTNLTELTISGSTISSIPSGSLDKLANVLQSLYLQNNRFTSVPLAISRLAALQTLIFQNNSLWDLTYLPPASPIQGLALQNNNLSDSVHLSLSLLPYRSWLHTLYLNDNQLTSLPNLTFLANVNSLDFSNNKIYDITSGGLSSQVTILNMANNRLPAIPRFISSLPAVTDLVLPANAITSIQGDQLPLSVDTLQMPYNLISELTDSSFPPKSSIHYMVLNNNPLVRISPSAFRNLPGLIELNLRGTRITRLPVSLSVLLYPSALDFSDCPYLVCTCAEKSLQPVIMRMYAANVYGDCGQTSIYNFYATFSPLCP